MRTAKAQNKYYKCSIAQIGESMKGNFKVRCVNIGRNHFYTVGKTYEFKDGFMVNDLGEKFPYKGKNSFEEWQDFSGSKWELVTDTKEITIRQKGRKVIAVMTEDGKYVKSANAKCNPTDEFDFNIGAKLAFSRLMGEEVAIIEYQPSIREAKRPAKVGEWIKIVDADTWSDEYENGDVFEVDELYTSRKEGIISSPHHIVPREYVVLENYQPEATKTLADFTDKELIDELARRLEDKQ